MPRSDLRVAWYSSLRWQLVLAFVLLLTLLLAVAGGVEYAVVRQGVISSQTQTIKSTFAVERRDLVRRQQARVRAGKPRLTGLAAADVVARELASVRLSVAVISSDGAELVTAIPGNAKSEPVLMNRPLALAPLDIRIAAAQFQTVSNPLLLPGPDGGSLAVVFPLYGRLGAQLGAVQVSQSAAPINTELNTAALVLTGGGVAVLLVALLIGLWLTSRGLGPLRQLTAAAEGVGKGDLSRRSGLAPRADEVGVLAQVFDEMADSVERTVRLREEAEQRMRRFIADASHELRTPLTVIKGYLDILQRGAQADPEAVRVALPTMAKEADRMRSLIMDLLTLARSDSQRALQPSPVDLARLIEDFLDSRPETSPVRRELLPGLVAMAEPDALIAILANLQSNAERHAPGAPVSWSTVDAGAMVGFCCADQGPGIPPSDLPHLFERFYRSGSSRSREDGGSGLGLSIVQALAESLGGVVSVESNPGAGARFTVLLPRAPAG